MNPVNEQSLKQLGFSVEQVRLGNKEGWMYRIKGKQPVYYLRKTKQGKLRAYVSQDAKFDTTIAGLYNFQERDGDIVGTPVGSSQKNEKNEKKGPQAVKIPKVNLAA